MILATAMIFVPLLAAAAIGLYIVLVFASHFFLTLVECTAQGQRQVNWPKEAFTEWLMQPIHLGWLAGLYLLPAVLVAASVGHSAGTHSVTLALTVVAFALLFPIGALSAFIARSVWIPFHPKAPVLLFSKPMATLAFYLVGIAACLAGIFGGYLALFAARFNSNISVIIGAILMALAWFVYACALGRLLFTLTYVPPPPRKKRKKKNLEQLSKELAEPEPDVPYWDQPPPAWDADRDARPYVAHEAEVVTKTVHADITKPKESEMRLLAKDPPPPPPKNPFSLDAFAPLIQNETMRHAILLAIMLALMTGVVRLLIDLNPVR